MSEDTGPHSNQPEISIPEDEQAIIEMLGDNATEQEKNLAVAQARLIGDL